MNEDIKVTFDSPEELNVELDAGAIQYGKLQVGITTTGAAGTKAKVENVGSSSNAILNFTIPRGDKGDKGDKGDAGSIKFIVVAELPTENIDESAIYMKPSSNQEESNTYEEFIYADGKWESLGAAQVKVDLEPYATKEDLNQLQDGVEEAFNGNEPMGSIVVEDVTCKNMFDYNNSEYGYYGADGINNTGSDASHVNRISDYINVESNKEYTASANQELGYFMINEFDENKNWLKRTSLNNVSTNTITTSSTTKYIRVSFNIDNAVDMTISKLIEIEAQIEKGSIATECTPYKKIGYNSAESMGKLVVDNITCKNLIYGFRPNYGFNTITGQYEYTTMFSSTEFIDVEVGETYVFSHAVGHIGGGVHCYDNNGTFLETLNQDTLLTPFTITNPNCKKIIIVTWDPNNNAIANETWMQLEKGTVATKYTPYKRFDCGKDDNIYSLEEIDTGKVWIDGKKIYRRVFTGTTPASQTGSSVFRNRIDALVKEDLYMLSPADYYVGRGYYENKEPQFSYTINKDTTVYFSLVATTAREQPFTLIIEYTKPDTEVVYD